MDDKAWRNNAATIREIAEERDMTIEKEKLDKV